MLKLRIVSPEKVLFDGEVERVIVPGTSGKFEILVNHAPIISSLEIGEVAYDTEAGRQIQHVEGGFVEVQKNRVNICVEV